MNGVEAGVVEGEPVAEEPRDAADAVALRGRGDIRGDLSGGGTGEEGECREDGGRRSWCGPERCGLGKNRFEELSGER